MKTVIVVAAIMAFAIVGLVVVGIYNDIYAEKFTLIKRDWKCVERVIYRAPQMVGKLTVTVRRSRCIKLERITG